ncbi:efflux transporter outer membrane subunit [Rhizorhabdus dicambivorans]|uniref:Multidrug transporter n=1 Tax=Rhizorhabdus dicambivorans TaxID=1850238 RepID=A0A2A4FU21_9SPHN|nr:efflux transporter outer membrane subunit [Rhizorhabdus dicambivorans]ATE64545.1 multidrug transporter [Rhizorhabdus dicambivorans]PCE41639.1 multidrug transporter [Rhizorhabdus dicambivorans]
MNQSRLTPRRGPVPLALALALAGCASIPDLGTRPELRAPGSIAAEQSFAMRDEAGQWPGDGWWRDYGDQQLTQLIEEGLRGSPDAAAAAARFRRAEGLAQAAGAPLLPSIDATGEAALQKQSYNNGVPAQFVPRGWQDIGRASLNLSYDLDLWGGNRAALAAATSEAEAAWMEQGQARLMLTTAIAAAYADLARLHAERDVLAAAVELRTATRQLVGDRVRSGLDTRAEQKQADAGVPQARADLAATEEAISLARNQIAALIGAGPDRGRDIARPNLATLHPPALPARITTELVGRRPDIAAARARAEAAARRIKAARADFYPAIRLDALVGLQSFGLENLAKGGSTTGRVGPAVSLPIFHGGAIAGQYRGARAAYDEAVASYDLRVLTAYREVADAVTSQLWAADRLAQSRQALADSEEAYAIARKRYEGGLSTYLSVLTAEEKLLQARRAVAALDARMFALDVALVRALGGGFTPNPVAYAKDSPNG